MSSRRRLWMVDGGWWIVDRERKSETVGVLVQRSRFVSPPYTIHDIFHHHGNAAKPTNAAAITPTQRLIPSFIANTTGSSDSRPRLAMNHTRVTQ